MPFAKKRKRGTKLNVETTKPEDTICAFCQSLEIEAALKEFESGQKDEAAKILAPEGAVIASVGTRFRQLLPTNECALCRLLTQTRVAATTKGGGGLIGDSFDELRAFSFLENYSGLQKNTIFLPGSKQDALFLAVVPADFDASDLHLLRANAHHYGYPVCYRKEASRRGAFQAMVVQQTFSVRQVNSWIRFCSDNHTRVCGVRTREVEGLRLIRCSSSEVVSAPDGAVYAALSYVWGSSELLETYASEFSNEATKLPDTIPRVVRDAIKATQFLGIKFLWVDKYCINQLDEEEKYHQIRSMDAIYMNAEITIVAAAGADEAYGLPGVGFGKSRLQRASQPVANLGKVRVVSTMGHPHSSIRKSKWATRGWTFQEAFLSKRRLVFTDEQVYYECEGMNCHESISSPLEELHLKDTSKFREFVRAGVFGRDERQAFGKFDTQKLPFEINLLQYWNAIQEYTSRELRFDRDAFDAFAGISHSFFKRANSVSEFWGIAFPYRPEQPEQGVYSSDARDYFADALGWSHTQDPDGAEPRLRRRAEFPSWSWVGWQGEARYLFREDIARNPKLYLPEAGFVRLESGPDLDVDIQTIIDMTNEGRSRLSVPRRLRFVAYTVSSNLFSLNERGGFAIYGIPAELGLSEPSDGLLGLVEEFKAGERLFGVYLSFWKATIKILVLRSRGETCTRVGILSIAGGVLYNKQVDKLWHKIRPESAIKTFVVE